MNKLAVMVMTMVMLVMQRGTADDAAKAMHAIIINSSVDTAKLSLLSRLLILCNVNSSQKENYHLLN